MGITEHKRGGNSLIFGILLILNIALLVLGIAVLSLGIYSCEENKNFSWYNGSFIFIGFLAIITAFIGHLIRYSPFHLFVYECTLILLFLLHLIFTVLVYANSHLDLNKSNDEMFKFVLVQMDLTVLGCIFLAGFYWKTLELANKPSESSEIGEAFPHSPFIKN